MTKKNQHVVPLGNGWAIRGEGNDHFTLIFETKTEAVKVAKQMAKNYNSELIIHEKDGRISDKYCNGKTPLQPKKEAHRTHQ